MVYVALIILALLVPTSMAIAQTAPQTFALQVSAASSTYQDSLCNSLALNTPSTIAVGTFRLAPAASFSSLSLIGLTQAT